MSVDSHPTNVAAADPGHRPLSRKELTQIAFGSFAGTAVEYYDYLVYALASAIVIGPLFFPSGSTTISTLAAFGTFAAGFLMRPLGGVVIGHFGDRVSRRTMLIFTLLLMGVATVLIGVLPTYQQAGVWAPVLLVILRLIQGFAAGGEFGGAALIIVERAPPDQRGFYGSWPVLGVSIGALLAVLMFFALRLLTPEQFMSWGWRIPFLASIVIIVIGLWIRMLLEESSDFLDLKKKGGKPPSMPFVKLMNEHWKEVIFATGSLLAYAMFIYICFTFAINYGTSTLGVDRNVFLFGMIIGIVLQIFTIPYCGHLSDRFGRKRVLLWGNALILLYAFPLFYLINLATTGAIIFAIALAFVLASASHAPIAALFSELFATSIRYSGVSISYQLASILGGGIAPLLATALYASTGLVGVSTYMMVVAIISMISIALLHVDPENMRSPH